MVLTVQCISVRGYWIDVNVMFVLRGTGENLPPDGVSEVILP
jgi:hypothetical protein